MLEQQRGVGGVPKYNPHLWSDEQLRTNFVVRERELGDLLQAVREAAPASPPQHMLLVGQRGMGKTTLLRRLALAVADDPALNQNWLALTFPEEQYTVSHLADLWCNVLDALADQLEKQGDQAAATRQLDQQIEALQALPLAEREDAALACLLDWTRQHQRRLLLLIDSTDLLFDSLAASDSKARSPGAASPLWRLRRTLSSESSLFWLGCSYQVLEGSEQYGDAFLDFFSHYQLRSLSVDDMQRALLSLAHSFGSHGQHGDAARIAMQQTLNAHPERLQTLRQLSGGNPRTTVMLYELFASGGEADVYSDLRRLLDNMTPLYKHRLEALADQPRKLLAHLLENWAPLGLKELAAASSIPATTISGQLNRMESEGLIRKTPAPSGKKNHYEVGECLFNVWYLMRNSPRRLRQRLLWLVEFMRLWYSPQQLSDLALRHCDRRRGRNQDELEYARALALALPDDSAERHQLEWSVFRETRERMREQLGNLFDLADEDKSFVSADDYLRRFDALEEGLRKCPHAEGEALDRWVDAVRGSLSLSIDEKERVATATATLSNFQYVGLVRVYDDETNEWIRLHGDSACVVLQNATRVGRFLSRLR